MNIKLSIVIISGVLILLYFIINMIRKEKLDLRYSLTWITVLCCILVLAIWPSIIDYFSSIIGVYEPMNALFFMGMVLQLLIIFSLTIAQSRNSKKIKELTQKVALYEYENKSKNY